MAILLRVNKAIRVDHCEIWIMSEYEGPQMKIGELENYSRKIYAVAKVISMGESREVTSRKDNSVHHVCEALVADDTGSILLTLWDEAIDEVEEGMVLRLNNAYVNVFRGSMRLNLGKYGSFEVLDDAPFEDVELENNLSDQQVEFRQKSFSRRNRRRY
jgi:replication factor A1